MSKGFYKNRRLKSALFLLGCFLIAITPHIFVIKNFFYLTLILSFVVAVYGLVVISKNFKSDIVLNTVNKKLTYEKLPILDILVAARDEENVIERLRPWPFPWLDNVLRNYHLRLLLIFLIELQTKILL